MQVKHIVAELQEESGRSIQFIITKNCIFGYILYINELSLSVTFLFVFIEKLLIT